MFIDIHGTSETIIFISCLFVFSLMGRIIGSKILKKLKLNGRSVVGILITSTLLVIGIVIANNIAKAIISF